METNWVDFRAVKAAVTMQLVLEHYQINWLRKRDDELRGRCPIHKGEGQSTFHVSLIKNVFHCFSCKARGNVLDFVAAMEQCSVRDAAQKLQDWFTITAIPEIGEPATAVDRAESRGEVKAKNEPLKFQLKGIDHGHPYLAGRGISRETAEKFGVGFFAGRGSMHGRIVIPIHDGNGQLVAYAGRSIDDSEPKYKLPNGFHKSLVLYNLHRVLGGDSARQRVVVVEGFFDCMKLHQAGFSVLALMGNSMSEAQEELLVRNFKAAWLLLDGDEAGQKAGEALLLRLGRRMWVQAPTLAGGKQPDSLSYEELTAVLGEQ